MCTHLSLYIGIQYQFAHVLIHVCVYIYIHKYICIYIYRERESIQNARQLVHYWFLIRNAIVDQQNVVANKAPTDNTKPRQTIQSPNRLYKDINKPLTKTHTY